MIIYKNRFNAFNFEGNGEVLKANRLTEEPICFFTISFDFIDNQNFF